MVLYKIDVDSENNIKITADNDNINIIPITTLRLNNGKINENITTAFSDLEKDQQIINYLDSIKDGTNIQQLKALKIYPKAEYNDGIWPSYPDKLKEIEHKLIESMSGFLQYTSWLKVKKGTLLDPPKEYNECLWESGLGFSVFLKPPVTTVKTFGSFIDPLEKQNAEKVWPSINNSVEISPKFMALMGFENNSFLNATTITNSKFNYIMQIGCGEACQTPKCVITSATEDSSKYFSGNNEKKKLLNQNIATAEKVKYIVIKEWGDKMQVILYFIYYQMLKKQGEKTVIMITCDMVVFIFCLNLSLPCIYTGVYHSPNDQLKNERKYSILEFKPSNTPFIDALNRFNKKRINIIAENNVFIRLLNRLIEKSDTIITIQDKEHVFYRTFYEAILTDVEQIQQKLFDKYKEEDIEYAIEDSNKIKDVEEKIRNMESECILVPMLKVKKGTVDKFVILLTKSYTMQKPVISDKPAIYKVLIDNGVNVVNANKIIKRPFYNIGIDFFQANPNEKKLVNKMEIENITEGGGERTQSRRKTMKNKMNIINMYYTMFDKTKKQYFLGDEDANYNKKHKNNVDENFEDLLKKYDHDIQMVFDVTFDKAISEYISEYLGKNANVHLFYDTIYTLALYDSYLARCAAPIVSVDYIQYLFHEYVNTTVEKINFINIKQKYDQKYDIISKINENNPKKTPSKNTTRKNKNLSPSPGIRVTPPSKRIKV
jgi:hypothetical protein